MNQERVLRTWDLFTPEWQLTESDLRRVYRLNEYRHREDAVSSASALLPVAKRLFRRALERRRTHLPHSDCGSVM